MKIKLDDYDYITNALKESAAVRIRNRMRKIGISYQHLCDMLLKHNIAYNVRQLQNKIYNETLSADLYLLIYDILDAIQLSQEFKLVEPLDT